MIDTDLSVLRVECLCDWPLLVCRYISRQLAQEAVDWGQEEASKEEEEVRDGQTSCQHQGGPL